MYNIIYETKNSRNIISKCWSSIEAHHRVEEKVFELLEKGNADVIEPVIHSGRYNKSLINNGNGTYAFAYRNDLNQPTYAVYKCQIKPVKGVLYNGKRRDIIMCAKLYYAKDNTIALPPLFPPPKKIDEKLYKEYNNFTAELKQSIPMEELDELTSNPPDNYKEKLAELIKSLN